jgi:hypothetical protein
MDLSFQWCFGNLQPHFSTNHGIIGTTCNLKLPGLGLSLEYGPGTVVGFSGTMLEHEVSSFEGDRVCYAYFMMDAVHEWAKVPGGLG